MPTKDEVNSFSNMIRTISVQKQITRWEALIEYIESIDMEYAAAASLLDKPIKAEIAAEVDDLNLLKRKGKKSRKLPI